MEEDQTFSEGGPELSPGSALANAGRPARRGPRAMGMIGVVPAIVVAVATTVAVALSGCSSAPPAHAKTASTLRPSAAALHTALPTHSPSAKPSPTHSARPTPAPPTAVATQPAV